MERHHRPVRLPIEAFDNHVGAPDPAVQSHLAHETARALLHRLHRADDPEALRRTIDYVGEHGIDDLAELWAQSASVTLPGALWRLYLVHGSVAEDLDTASYAYRRGVAVDRSASRIVAGAVEPTGPREIRDLIDRILRGAFTGDFGDALDRAAAFSVVMSLGYESIAGDAERTDPERARLATARALRFLEFSKDLTSAARLWRRNQLG